MKRWRVKIIWYGSNGTALDFQTHEIEEVNDLNLQDIIENNMGWFHGMKVRVDFEYLLGQNPIFRSEGIELRAS